MTFPFTSYLSYVVHAVLSETQKFGTQTYDIATSARDYAQTYAYYVCHNISLPLSDAAFSYLQTTHEEISLDEVKTKYEQGTIRSQCDAARYGPTALPLQQKYSANTHDDKKLETAIVAIQDYLSATDMLEGEQRDKFLSLPLFSQVIDTIIDAQNIQRIRNLQTILSTQDSELSIQEQDTYANLDDIHTLVVNITQCRSDVTHEDLSLHLHTYFRLNELMQLLFMIHNIANGLSIRESQDDTQGKVMHTYGKLEDRAKYEEIPMTDVVNHKKLNAYSLCILKDKYLQQAQNIHQFRTYLHEDSSMYKCMLQIGQCAIKRKFLNALQMFLAIAACREMSAIAYREFNTMRIDYVSHTVGSTRHHKYYVNDNVFIAYKLFVMRIVQAMQLYYNHRALLCLCKALQVNKKIDGQDDKVKCIMNILKYHHEIVFALAAQLLSNLKASVLIYLLNKHEHIYIQVHEETHKLSSKSLVHVREEIIQKTLRSVLSAEAHKAVSQVLQSMCVPYNAQLKSVVVDIFTFYGGPIVHAEDHSAFRQYIHKSLDSFTRNICYDNLFLHNIDDIIKHITCLRHTQQTTRTSQRLRCTKNGKIVFDSENIAVIANIINTYSNPITLRTVADDLQYAMRDNSYLRDNITLLANANSIAPYQSHIIYFAIENILHKSQIFLYTKFKNVCTELAYKLTAVSCAMYGTYYAAQWFSLI